MGITARERAVVDVAKTPCLGENAARMNFKNTFDDWFEDVY